MGDLQCSVELISHSLPTDFPLEESIWSIGINMRTHMHIYHIDIACSKCMTLVAVYRTGSHGRDITQHLRVIRSHLKVPYYVLCYVSYFFCLVGLPYYICCHRLYDGARGPDH